MSRSTSDSQFVPQDDDAETLWEVEEIVAEKAGMYRIRWSGEDPATGQPWPLDWVKKHDCTPTLVADWVAKKGSKRSACLCCTASILGFCTDHHGMV
jgi:hypothetical protein